MSKILLKRVENSGNLENRFLTTIRRTAQSIRLLYEQIDISENDILQAVCEAAVTHLGSSKVAKEMGDSKSDEHDLLVDDLGDLLVVVAFLGNLDLTKRLLLKGASVNHRSLFFGTPLQAAASQGRRVVVVYLLGHRARVNSETGVDFTALGACARQGHLSIVSLLLQPVYGFKKSGSSYQQAIYSATRGGHTDVVGYLIRKSALRDDLRVRYEVLFLASGLGNLQMVEMLLDTGFAVEKEILAYKSPLERAAEHGHESIVSLLLGRAELKCVVAEQHALISAAREGHENVVRIFLDSGLDVNTIVHPYGSPLTQAAKFNRGSMARFLIFRGADLQPPGYGRVFRHAIWHGSEEVVRVLADFGVDVDGGFNHNNKKKAPILLAMMKGHDHIVKLLIELGAEWVDPLRTNVARQFRDGTYPIRQRPPPLLSP